MRTLKIGVCLLLILSLMCVPTVYAEEAVSPYASYYFATAETFLYIINGNRFGVWFDVMATGTMYELGVSSIVMQKSSDGVNWRNVKTFTPENYSQMISENDSYHSDGVAYTGTYYYYYRAYVEFYAKNSRGTGYWTMYTDILYLEV